VIEDRAQEERWYANQEVEAGTDRQSAEADRGSANIAPRSNTLVALRHADELLKRDRFTEGFDTADLKDAKALLDELGT